VVVETLTRRQWVRVIVLTALVASLVGAAVGLVVGYGSQKTEVEQFFPNRSALAKPRDVQAVLAQVEPAVVSIDTTVRTTSGGSSGGVVEGAGTGMILTPNGEVLTNNHVVAGASVVTVTLLGQSKALTAHVIGTDPGQDVALVQIDDVQGLPTVKLGDSDAVQVGDDVLAIGNALALAGGPTVTEGIVSAKGRSLSAKSETTGKTETLSGLLQTDAAINPGNSGGPLVDSQAQVIGMNTAVAESGAGNAPAQGIGFAIAINAIKPLLAQLRAGGTGGVTGGVTTTQANPRAPWLGVVVETVTASVVRQRHLARTSGAVVVGVSSGGPAAAAGIRVGDVIVSIAGQAVTSASQLVGEVQAEAPGDAVSLAVYRGSRERTVRVTLGSQPG
jgi:S1-C subfamily serine protease